jgi:hypothetical protein
MPKSFTKVSNIILFGLSILLTLFLVLSLFLAKNSFAQSPIQCGYNGEPCCNLAGSDPDSCRSGLTCENGTCVPSDPNFIPPGRGQAEPGEEYHSLRPYPGDPYNQSVSDTALFCGNQLVLQDTVRGNTSNCVFVEDGKLECTVTRTKEIAIDLSEADLPILGNTEDVVNSESQTSDLDSAEKVTGYVSWYLSGVPNKAELPAFDPENPEDVSDLVNFSGPLNKLIPKEIQQRERIATIDEVNESRHNQIIGCVNAAGGITECYPDRAGVRKVRLSDWEDHLPPLESEIGDEFKDFKDYWIAYKRWRGQSCLRLPIIDAIVCANNPLKPDYWGNLWANIPLSSTEDRTGTVETETIGVQPASEGVEVSDVVFSNQSPAELYFAHTEEDAELASLLQKTYVAGGQSQTGGVSGISPSEFGSCDLTNVRTNPGDDLYASEISGSLTYTAKFICDAETEDCYEDCVAGGGPLGICGLLPVCGEAEVVPSSSCTKTVNVGLSLQTNTPRADEIWKRTVAGSASIFKRIFPKIGLGGPILGILDIPAATKVSYTSRDGTAVLAGSPQNQRSGEGAELYFPHFGGVSEYFLKGIQTALRPKGFGQPILSGALGTFGTSGDINCDQNAPEISLKGSLDKESFLQLALRWRPDNQGTHALECYNDVVKRAREAGVNPGLALWLWLHESGASNYDISDEDFGVHTGKPAGFVAQIEGFFARAKSPTYRASSGLCVRTGVTNDLHAWALIYRSGNCDPNGRGKSFYDDLLASWNYVNPRCPLPDSPTDMSCPR